MNKFGSVLACLCVFSLLILLIYLFRYNLFPTETICGGNAAETKFQLFCYTHLYVCPVGPETVHKLCHLK